MDHIFPGREKDPPKLPFTGEGGDRVPFQKSLLSSARLASSASAIPQVPKDASPGMLLSTSPEQ